MRHPKGKNANDISHEIMEIVRIVHDSDLSMEGFFRLSLFLE